MSLNPIFNIQPSYVMVETNFYDKNDNHLPSLSNKFRSECSISVLLDHLALLSSHLHPNCKISNITIKPRSNNHHSGWNINHGHLTIIAAIQSLNSNNTQIDCKSFDFMVVFNNNDNNDNSSVLSDNVSNTLISSSDDTQSIYTVNDDNESNNGLNAIDNQINNLNLNLNLTPIPEDTQIINNNTNQFNNNININNNNIDNNNNDGNNDDNTSDNNNNFDPFNLNPSNNNNNDNYMNLPPSHDIPSRAFVRTIHQLMGKDIVIPAPSIPNDMQNMVTYEQFRNIMPKSNNNNNNNNDQNDDDDDDDHKDSYYNKILNTQTTDNPFSELLKYYPRRITERDSDKFTILNDIDEYIPSLSSYLKSKRKQRERENESHLQRIRMGTHQSIPQLLNQSTNINNNNNNNNINIFGGISSLNNIDDTNGTLQTLQVLKDIGVTNNNNNNGNSYYDQIMNNNMNPFFVPKENNNNDIDIDDINLNPIPIAVQHGRTLRLDSDILALGLIEPWAYAIINKKIKVFCYRGPFDSDKYPNGYWYALRVPDLRNFTDIVYEECELLREFIPDLPVMQDCLHSAKHVIGFVHVYKSTQNVDELKEIHPNMVDLYSKCNGGTKKPKKKPTKLKINKNTAVNTDVNTNINTNTNTNTNIKNDNSSSIKMEIDDNSNHNNDNNNNNRVIDGVSDVDDDHSQSIHSNMSCDSFIVNDIDISDNQSSLSPYISIPSSLTNSPLTAFHKLHTKKKSKTTNEKYYWFVDEAFGIMPYPVEGALGGAARFYNISRRNYDESLVLGGKLSEYLCRGIKLHGIYGDNNDNNKSLSSLENEDSDAKEEQLPDGEINTLSNNNNNDDDDDNDDNKSQSALNNAVSELNLNQNDDKKTDEKVLWIDRTLAKHIGFNTKHSKKPKKLSTNKKIAGWRNVLNDFSVVEVEQQSDDDIYENKVKRLNSNMMDNNNNNNNDNKENSQQSNEPPIKSFELFQAAGMITKMDDNADIFGNNNNNNNNNMFNEPAVPVPHADDSSDSDYLGEDEALYDDDNNTIANDNDDDDEDDDIDNVNDIDDNDIKTNNKQNIDDDDDIDLDDIMQEINECDIIQSSFVTAGGPTQITNDQHYNDDKDEDDDNYTVAIEDIADELNQVINIDNGNTIDSNDDIDMHMKSEFTNTTHNVQQTMINNDNSVKSVLTDTTNNNKPQSKQKKRKYKKRSSTKIVKKPWPIFKKNKNKNYNINSNLNYYKIHNTNHKMPTRSASLPIHSSFTNQHPIDIDDDNYDQDIDLLPIQSNQQTTNLLQVNDNINGDDGRPPFTLFPGGTNEMNINHQYDNHNDNEFKEQSDEDDSENECVQAIMDQIDSEKQQNNQDINNNYIDNYNQNVVHQNDNVKHDIMLSQITPIVDDNYNDNQDVNNNITQTVMTPERNSINYDQNNGSVILKLSPRIRHVYLNESEAYKSINETVYAILFNATVEERKEITKKTLRKMVSKRLNISKTKYKTIIDKCGKMFINSLGV